MACWDDWDDDWDDWDDWGDDWSSWDSDWCHYNDDDGSYWLNNVDVTPDDIGGDDDGSIWLDEVFVTYNVDDDDNNDNLEDDDNNDDDFGWFDGEDDTIIGYGSDNNKENTNSSETRKYIAQDCQLCCVPTVMAIMNMYAYGISIEDAEKLIEMYRKIYEEMTGNNFYNTGVYNSDISSFMKACGFNIAVCSTDAISICLANNYQVFVYIDVYDGHGNKYGHALDIIGITNSGLYECINPLTGKVELHSKEEFKHPIYNYCIKSIDKIY